MVSMLAMVNKNEIPDAQQEFDAALKIPDIPREKLNLNIPKHIELLPHYFEFPGACAGGLQTEFVYACLTLSEDG